MRQSTSKVEYIISRIVWFDNTVRYLTEHKRWTFNKEEAKKFNNKSHAARWANQYCYTVIECLKNSL